MGVSRNGTHEPIRTLTSRVAYIYISCNSIGIEKVQAAIITTSNINWLLPNENIFKKVKTKNLYEIKMLFSFSCVFVFGHSIRARHN